MFYELGLFRLRTPRCPGAAQTTETTAFSSGVAGRSGAPLACRWRGILHRAVIKSCLGIVFIAAVATAAVDLLIGFLVIKFVHNESFQFATVNSRHVSPGCFHRNAIFRVSRGLFRVEGERQVPALFRPR